MRDQGTGQRARARTAIATLTSVIVASCAVVLALVMVGCNQTQTWTLCLYLCGSDLESSQGWATSTLDELVHADLPQNVTIVVQTGGASTWHNDTVDTHEMGRYIVKNHKLTPVDSAGKGSMGTVDTLASFLVFCEQTYPANHTAVVLWDHGGGPLKGACFDEAHGNDPLTLPELGEALGAGVESRGSKPYDIVGLDACLMGSLETATTLAGSAEYFVASEEVEPGAGWDYAKTVRVMGESAEPKTVAIAICDAYMAKCESGGRDATATLAAIDLAKMQDVRNALREALVSLRESQNGKDGALRWLAACSYEAQPFGGATSGEGASNLVDLKGIAQALAANPKLNVDDWNKVVAAIDEAVVHRVAGKAEVGAFGLSVWYPRSSTRKELADYKQISPLDEYVKTLEELFSESMGQVVYVDAGSQDGGSLRVSIAPEAARSFYNLYVVNRRTDGDYENTNFDIRGDWDNLSFWYDPAQSVCITLNGMTLDSQAIDYDNDRTLLTCPITLNGKRTNLRIERVKDSEGKAHYETLGTWNGINDIGFAGRLGEQLHVGDTVGAVSLATGEERETIKIVGTPVVKEVALEPGTYECHFISYDLHGKEYPSNSLVYEVTEDGRTVVK